MLIEFGLINYKILIPFIYPIFYQIRRYIHINSNPFYILFTEYLGYLCGGLIYILILHRIKSAEKKNLSKKDEEKENEIKMDKSLEILNDSSEDIEGYSKQKLKKKKSIIMNPIQNQIVFEKIILDKKNVRKKYIFIALLAMINLIPMPLEAFTGKDVNLNFKMGSSLLYFIFFYAFFSILILGEKLYRHRILSLVIIVIVIPFLLFFYLKNEANKKNENLFINSLYLILIACLYALYNVLTKKYYNIYFGSPYHFMFVIGLISLSIIALYEAISLIITGVKKNDYNGIIYQIEFNFNKYSFLYLLIFIGDIISSFLWLAGIQLTMYFFTPCHFIISESLSQIFTTFIENSLKEYNISSRMIIYIIYLIIIFASMIYNEIFIINIFNLNHNTRKKIEERVLQEKEASLYLLENEAQQMNIDNNS